MYVGADTHILTIFVRLGEELDSWKPTDAESIATTYLIT